MARGKAAAADDSLGDTLFEQGITGLRTSGGFVDDEEFIPELKGRAGRRTYREMGDNDPICSATLNIIELLLKQTKLSFESQGNSQLALQISDFVDAAWHDMIEGGGTANVLPEALSGLTFGWSWQEKVFKLRRGLDHDIPEMRSKFNDGRIAWRKMPIRAQETHHRWRLGRHNEVLGWEQMAMPDNRLRILTRKKGLHYRFKNRKENPEGVSMLRGAYTSWYRAKHFRFVEAVGIERDLAGYPFATIPMKYLKANATAADKLHAKKFFDMIRKVRRDHNEGLVFPPEEDEKGNKTGYSFQLLSSGGRRPSDADVVIKRYESRMAMTLLSEFLLLGQDKVGSFALADSKTDLFALGLASILDTFVNEITMNAIPELVALNGWPTELSPKMVHGDVEAPNLADLAAYIQATVSTGAIIRDDKLERHLREVATLPEPEPDPLPRGQMPLPLPQTSAHGPSVDGPLTGAIPE